MVDSRDVYQEYVTSSETVIFVAPAVKTTYRPAHHKGVYCGCTILVDALKLLVNLRRISLDRRDTDNCRCWRILTIISSGNMITVQT
jgi:uncharacterized protein YycO